MNLNEKWKEYQEQQERKKYFRSQNDLFLDRNQWIKVILHGLLGAVVIGVVHGLFTSKLGIDFSLFYLIIGYAMANIIVSASGVQSQQMAYASVALTFLTFYISRFVIIMMPSIMLGIPFIYGFKILWFTLRAMFSSGLFDLIFMLVGLFVAYQQAE